MDFPQRVHPRLRTWDYSSSATYFLTLCTKQKKPILSAVVGRGILDAPQVKLKKYGRLVSQTLAYMNAHNEHIHIDAQIIMPNHVHLLVTLQRDKADNGASGMPRPTNSKIPSFVSSFKRYTNKICADRLWQDGYHDHIVRDENDYYRIMEYIHTNPAKWLDDRYYVHHE